MMTGLLGVGHAPGEIRTASPPTLRAMTGLRAVAASWVLLEHFRRPMFDLLPATRIAEPWIASGYLGVEVFFVLSGFIISYNCAERFRDGRRGAYTSFLWARFARIYPVHLATLVATGGLVAGAAALGLALHSQGTFTADTFVGNLVLLQALPGVTPWNGPSWSISCEAAAYILFPLLAIVVMRLRRRTALVAGGAVLAAEIVVLLALGTSSSYADAWTPVMWTRILGEFTLGCLLWSAWRHGVRPHRNWDLVAVGAVAASIAVLALVEPKSASAFLALPFIAVLVIAIPSTVGPVHRLLSSRVLEWGGRVSYSVYLTHFLVLVVLQKIGAWQQFVDTILIVRLAVVVAYFALAVGVGALTYYVIEEPARRSLRRRARV